MDKNTIIRIVVIVIAIVVAAIGICALNSIGVDKSAFPKEITIVERVFRKTEYTSQRVGRRGSVRSNPHPVYYLELRRADGTTKKVKTDFKTYDMASKGDTALLPVGRGRLGWEIIDAINRMWDRPEALSSC